MSKPQVTARTVKTTRGDEPFGWFDDAEMKQAEHPLAIVGRSMAILQSLAFGVDGEGDMKRVFDGLSTAIIDLAKAKNYDALGWLLYGLEAATKAEYREDWPASERPRLATDEDAS